MAVDPNLTKFVDLVVNDADFRAAISSGDRERITAALADPHRELTLSAGERDAAATALIAAGNLGTMSALEGVLSHRPIGVTMN